MSDPFPGPADGDPSDLVVAYCAPGLKGYAICLLESNGERVREVIEHPWMIGRTDVILMTDPFWPTLRVKVGDGA